MHRLAAASVLAVLLLALAAPASAEEAFNFAAYFPGEWELENLRVSSETGEPTGLTTWSHYSIHPASGDNVTKLTGEFFVNDTYTGEADLRLRVAIETEESGVAGEFSVAAVTDDGSEPVFLRLFHFDFAPTASGLRVSQGRYLAGGDDAGDATYTFMIVGASHWVFTINYGPGGGGDSSVHTVVARRISLAGEASFFQKYGSSVMMMGLFLVTRFMGNRFAPKPTQEERDIAREISREGTARRQGGGARITEINDGDDGAGDGAGDAGEGKKDK